MSLCDGSAGSKPPPPPPRAVEGSKGDGSHEFGWCERESRNVFGEEAVSYVLEGRAIERL